MADDLDRRCETQRAKPLSRVLVVHDHGERARSHLQGCRKEEIADLAMKAGHASFSPGHPGLTMIPPHRIDISSGVTAGKRHLHDQMVEHDLVQNDEACSSQRLPIDELMMRVVAELIDGQIEPAGVSLRLDGGDHAKRDGPR